MSNFLGKCAGAVWKRTMAPIHRLKLRFLSKMLLNDWMDMPVQHPSLAIDDALKDLDKRALSTQRIAGLLEGLEEEDRAHFKFLIQRLLDFPRLSKGRSFAFNRESLMTQEERDAFALWKASQDLYKGKYRFEEGFLYTMEVFLHRNGLPFLPEKARAHIEGRNVMDLGAFVGDSALVFLECKPRKLKEVFKTT